MKLKNIITKTGIGILFYAASWGVLGLATNDWNPNCIHQFGTEMKQEAEWNKHRNSLEKLEKLADINGDGRVDGNEFEIMLKELGVNYDLQHSTNQISGKVYYSFSFEGKAPTLTKLESAIKSYEQGKHVRTQYPR